MKKALFTASIFLGSSAFAGMAIDLRSDYRSTPSYDYISNVENSSPTAKATTKEEGLFILSRARVKVDGELAPNIKAYTRLNLLSSTNTANDKSGPAQLVEYAFISHDVNKNLTITAGKLAALVGGHEGDYNWADIYFATHTGGTQNGSFGGVSFDLKPMDNQLISIVAGNNEDTTAGDQKKAGTGVFYRGGVMDNKINIAAHYMSTYKGTQGNEKSIKTSSFGIKYTGIANLVVDVEYLGNANDAGGSGNAIKDSTGYINAKYFFTGNWASVVKAESSTHKDEVTDTKSFDRTRAGLALEYYPLENNQNFRYHVAYDAWTDKFKTATSGRDTVNASELFLGMRFYTDLGK